MNPKRQLFSFTLLTLVMLSLAVSPISAKRRKSKRRKASKEKLIITDNERGEFLEYLKEEEPYEYRKLLLLEEQDPEAYKRVVHRGARDLQQLQELKDNDPETYKRIMAVKGLRKNSEDLAIKYMRTADKKDREKVGEELKGVLEELFDIREAQRALAIRAMKARVRSLEGQFMKRREHRDEIIENRLRDITGQNEYLSW